MGGLVVLDGERVIEDSSPSLNFEVIALHITYTNADRRILIQVSVYYLISRQERFVYSRSKKAWHNIQSLLETLFLCCWWLEVIQSG